MSDSPSRPSPTPHADAVHPILTHERSLANKIAKGSEAGDILDQQMAMLGIQLVSQLNVLIKTSRIHGRTNAALDHPVDSMLTLVKTLAADRPVVVRLQNDFLFLGDNHLKMNAQQMTVFGSIIEALNKWRVGSVSFTSTTGARDLREFAYLFVSLDPEKLTLADLQEAMTTANVKGIELEEPRVLSLHLDPGQSAGGSLMSDAGTSSSGSEDPKQRAKARAKGGYAKAVAAVGDLAQNTRASGRVTFKQAKRAIQNIVELMMQDESTILGLTNLRSHDQYTHNHSVNVALLAMALGNRAGYPKLDLADLGLSALFHDVGKCAISLDLLNKPGEFTQEEWTIMRSHPTEGVFTLVRSRGITKVPARMAAASFEHHMNYDYSGYPKLRVPWTQSVGSRIITIADCYDAMTSSRVYRREPMSPSNVLKFMFSKSGQSFDPVLLKLFVNCVGIIPIGSLVRLDSGPLAVVLKPAATREDAERPTVKVITDVTGAPLEEGPELDLTERDDTGVYRHSVVQLVDNTEHHFNTSRYFV